MSTERIDIEVTDNVAPSITVKFQNIAANAEQAATAIDLLQKQLAGLATNSLDKLVGEFDRLAVASKSTGDSFAAIMPTVNGVAAAADKIAAAWQASSTATSVVVTANERLAASFRAVETAARAAASAPRVSAATGAASLAGGGADAAAISATATQLQRLRDAGSAASTEMSALSSTLSQVSSVATSVADSFSHLSAAFKVIVFIQIAQAVKNLIDEYTELTNRLAILATSQDNLEKSLIAVYAIADKTRAPVASLAQLYQQAGIAAKELNVSQQESEIFITAVGQALAIQGGSARSAQGALIQLSQALGSGIVRAEEFNSMLEGAYTIVKYAAQGIDRMGGSVARLRQEVISGKVSSSEFFNAILSQAPAIETQFNKTTATIEQSMVVLRNKLSEFIGTSHIAADATTIVAGSIMALANSIDILGRVLVASAISYGLYKIITSFRAANDAILAVIAANEKLNLSTIHSANVSGENIVALGRTIARVSAEEQAALAALAASQARIATLAPRTSRGLSETSQRYADWQAEIRISSQLQDNVNRIQRDLAQLHVNREAQASIALMADDALRATTAFGLAREKVTQLTSAVVAYGRNNPFIAQAATISAVIGVLYAFSSEIEVSSKKAVTLHDVGAATFKAIGGALSSMYELAKLALEGWIKIFSAIIGAPFRDLQRLADALGFKDIDVSLYGAMRGISRLLDYAVGAVKGVGLMIINQFVDLGKSSAKLFWEAFTGTPITDYVFGDIEDKFKQLMTEAEKEMEARKAANIKQFGPDYGSAASASNPANQAKLNDLLDKQNREMQQQIDLYHLIGMERLKQQAYNKIEDKAADAKLQMTAKQIKEEKDRINTLEQTKAISAGVDQLYNSSALGRSDAFVMSVRSIAQALQSQVITADEAGVAITKLAHEYNLAAMTPLQRTLYDMNEELTKQIALFGKVGKEAAITNAEFSFKQKAKTSGETPTDSQLAEVRKTAESTYYFGKAQEYVNDVYQKSISPVETYNEKVKALNYLRDKGTVSTSEYTRAMTALDKELHSSLEEKRADSIAHVILKLDDEINKTKLLSVEKEKEAKFDQIKESLDSKHIKLSEDEVKVIKDKIAAVVEATKVQQHMESIYNSTEGTIKDYQRVVIAVNDLYKKSPQYVHQYVRALDDARMKVLEMNNTVVAGIEHGILAEYKKVSDTTGIISNYMTTAFSTMEDAFVGYLKTGKMEWASFGQSIIEQTMHMVTQLMIIAPIIKAIKAAISGSAGIGEAFTSSVGSMVGFAGGGDFMVGGAPGTDNNIVAFRASRNERVIVQTPEQQKSGTGGRVHVNIANYGVSKDFGVEQIDANTVRIIARDEAKRTARSEAPHGVAAALRDPNSTVSKALASNTTAGRRR